MKPRDYKLPKLADLKIQGSGLVTPHEDDECDEELIKGFHEFKADMSG
jgi:hypothetical protein